jgi:hypothetical protein
MNKNKLKKIQREIRSLRKRSGSVTERELVAIAKKLGRQRANRGTEPTYISDNLPGPPIRIPSHPGTLKQGTALSILDDLETDVFNWRARLDRESRPNTDEQED